MNVTTTVPFAGNKEASGSECQSWWGSTVLGLKEELLLSGFCKPADRNAPIIFYTRASRDGGHSWTPQQEIPDGGPFLYSKSSDEVIMFAGPPPSLLSPMECEAALNQYCPGLKAQKDTCLSCLNSHPNKFFDGACTHSELSDYCDKTAPPCPKCPPPGPPPPPPPPPPPGQELKPVWASELPQLSAQKLADPSCWGGMMRSRDGGRSFTNHTLIHVNNSLGPHYIGGGLNHGIQLQNGPHKGRLVQAMRFDTSCANTPDYMRSYALFSDDLGQTWTAGQLLPAGWTEDQLAEMYNGSILITSRLESRNFPQFNPDPANSSDLRNHRRAFARSDDGGYTWAELWHLADRQPEIQEYVAECAHALTSDPETGTMWWAHPGGGADGHDRYNGTLQQSNDGGATWEFAAHISTGGYPAGGYGYSDIHLTSDGALGVLYQRTFDPPERSIEGGGYDLAFARIEPLKRVR